MAKVKRYSILGLLIGVAVSATSGCSSIMSHSGGDQGYYSGTRAGLDVITDDHNGWVMRPLALIDLPFSAMLDTLLLPLDYYHADNDKADASPRERVLRSEQQNHTDEALSHAVPARAVSY
ncbi:MAG: hypothetical protein XXXJIFNMEKO3_03342 [Candidatus Erwinia impunctatus]|nr:hypothetical protein XXXJIFNMEKO_03342 [Culicoides impunctatus]